MDVVLIILGVLGFGAIVIAAYVFTVAARNYVSDEETFQQEPQHPPRTNNLVARQPVDRRCGAPVSFPLTVNSVKVPRDRRTIPERRLSAA